MRKLGQRIKGIFGGIKRVFTKTQKPSAKGISKSTTPKAVVSKSNFKKFEKGGIYYERKKRVNARVERLMNKLQLTGNQRNQLEQFLNVNKSHTKKDYERIMKFVSQIENGNFNYKRWIPKGTEQRESFDMIAKEIERTGKTPTYSQLFTAFNRSEFYLKNKELIMDYNENYYNENNPFERELRNKNNQYQADKIADLLNN